MKNPRLKKFHLSIQQHLIYLIYVISFVIISQDLQNLPVFGQEVKGSEIKAVIIPNEPKVGDIIRVKIAKINNESKAPKVFFDKTKLPAFFLPGDWYRVLIPLPANFKAGKYQLEIFYSGHVKRIDLVVSDTKFPLQDLILPKEIAAIRASQIEKVFVGKALSTISSNKLWTSKFIYPSLGLRSTVYGVKRRVNGIIDPDYFHKGLDFAAKNGSNVTAPANGKVILAGLESKGFVANGNCIFLDHGHGVISAYLHLSKLLVKEGDFVKKGQIIGKVGSSGIASGPHLHWGVYVLGKTVDPLQWIGTVIE